ncbi:MAG: hypothetical protein WCE75_02235 [Terracidiphilus sp.]
MFAGIVLATHATLATRIGRHFERIAARSPIAGSEIGRRPCEISGRRYAILRPAKWYGISHPELTVKAALSALNCLVAEGVLKNYAIGGAIAASFYLPAMQTEDIDAFVFLPGGSGFLVSLAPVYEALKAKGGTVVREYVRFGEWPLQILTDANELIADAIREAIEVDYEGTPTRVFRPEHLCAIALQTGRSKDFARVALFVEGHEVDLEVLRSLAERYGLTARLNRVLDSTRGDTE